MPTESRGAEAITAGWMLAALNALVLQILWIVLRALMHYNAGLQPLQLLASLLLLVAIVLGMVVVVLTPVVYRVRCTPPPRNVTIAVLLVGLSPLGAMTALWFAGG